MASEGYPAKYDKGFEINIDKNLEAELFIAGAKKENGKLHTSGGRVLGITAVENNLEKAIEKAYKEIEKVNFKNAYYRKDIGKKCLDVWRS